MRGKEKNSHVVAVTLPSQKPGRPNTPIIKELTINVADQLTLELLPRSGGAPIISGLRIESQQTPN